MFTLFQVLFEELREISEKRERHRSLDIYT